MFQLARQCDYDSIFDGKADPTLAIKSCIPDHLLMLSQSPQYVPVRDHGFPHLIKLLVYRDVGPCHHM